MPMRRHLFLPVVCTTLFVVSSIASHAQIQHLTLTIDAAQAKAKSSPTLYGLMTEEINYSYDGGLYGELIRNRAIRLTWSGADHWTLIQRGNSQGSMSVDEKNGPSTAIPSSLKLVATAASEDAPVGVENEGYWGIPVRQDTTYQASFWAKSSTPGADVTLAFLDDNSGKTFAVTTVHNVGTEWKQYTATLHTGQLIASSRHHFVLSLAKPGTLWLNLASVFPPTYNGRAGGNRIDLMEKLAAMHPAFLRLPGGNYLEGDHIATRFEWKKTIGPIVDRPTHPSPWGYQSSDGMGLLEFLEWCEDLHMQPVLAVYAGYSLQGEHVDAGPALTPYVQDALEEIEYVTGDASTKWGAERAKDGHPEPFKLQYVEIGNEDQFDKSGSYSDRYAQFYDAIKKQYPNLQLIATTPVKNHAYDVVDDHYYKQAQEFYDDVNHYDSTPRSGPKVFVGEWATREGTPTPNFGAALGDAAWMTGMERNSDVIVMASYAPLFTNVNPGGLQWDTDLIGYNALTSYGSPSYYAQVLFAQHHGDEILTSNFSNKPVRVFQSVTRDANTRTIYLKLVNASGTPAEVNVQLNGTSSVAATGTDSILTAPTTETTNTIDDPNRVSPSEQQLSKLGKQFPLVLAPLSIHVLELHTR